MTPGPPAPDRKTGPADYAALIYRRYFSSRAERRRPGQTTGAANHYYYQAKISQWLPPDRSSAILDLGCGGGNFLGYMSSLGYTNLTGVDIGPEQVQLAKAAVPGARIHELDFFAFLEEDRGRYDLIAAQDVIEHLKKEQVIGFLQSVRNALVPGGRLVLQTPNAASPWGMSMRYGDFTHECCFTPEGLRQLLTIVGFGEIEVQAAGPVAHGLLSTVRWVFWSMFSCYYRMVNLVEMGTAGEGIYTRVFQCSAVKEK
jgi:2-polyprenyl-3-methyl-5-hydroxy-6-metoxy-1,4-benzoquinol methylase